MDMSVIMVFVLLLLVIGALWSTYGSGRTGSGEE